MTYFQEEKEHRKEKQDQKDRKEGGGHEGSTSGEDSPAGREERMCGC